MEAYRFLAPYLRPYLRSYLLGIAVIPLSTVCALLIPRFTGEAAEFMRSSPGDMSRLYTLGAFILLCAIGRGVGMFGTRHFLISASRRIEFDLRNHLFRHFEGLDRPFFDGARTGDLMSRATSDIDATRTVVGPGIMYSVNTAFLLLVAIPMMLRVNARLTLLVLVPLSLLTISVRLIGPRVQKAFRRAQESLGSLSSFAQENCGGIRVVKTFAIEDREIGRFRSLCDDYYDRNLATERISNWMHPVVGAVTHLSVILLLLVGGQLIIGAELELGQFIEFAGYQALLIWPMISIGWVVNQVFRGVASMRRLGEIFSRTSTVVAVEPASPPAAPPTGPGLGKGTPVGIEIRDLTFAYGDGPPVLRDVSLEIPAGQKTAIIGRTGSGKTTLAHLLTRLYPVPEGAIFIDGVDINRFPLERLRRVIGMVPQDTFLFSRSIADNIAFGSDGPPEEEAATEAWQQEILAHARTARIDKDLDQFREGLEAVVGERGVTLSGGQRQRVAISRALHYEPRVLVLDDALSAVDTYTEEEISRNLREATEGLTVLTISHRLASIRDADCIHVLEEGRVTQSGTHAELVEQGGLYGELHRLQQLERALEDL